MYLYLDLDFSPNIPFPDIGDSGQLALTWFPDICVYGSTSLLLNLCVYEMTNPGQLEMIWFPDICVYGNTPVFQLLSNICGSEITNICVKRNNKYWRANIALTWFPDIMFMAAIHSTVVDWETYFFGTKFAFFVVF